jgi:phage terminase small subunit
VKFYLGEAVFNASKAAKLAGYTGTPANLRRQGCDMLRHPEIRAAIDEAMAAKVATGNVMSGDEVLAELSAIGRIPLYVDKVVDVDNDGNEIKEKIATEARDIKNKVAALQTLAKYHGLLIDRVKVDVDVSKLSDQELEAIISAEGESGA